MQASIDVARSFGLYVPAGRFRVSVRIRIRVTARVRVRIRVRVCAEAELRWHRGMLSPRLPPG